MKNAIKALEQDMDTKKTELAETEQRLEQILEARLQYISGVDYDAPTGIITDEGSGPFSEGDRVRILVGSTVDSSLSRDYLLVTTNPDLPMVPESDANFANALSNFDDTDWIHVARISRDK